MNRKTLAFMLGNHAMAKLISINYWTVICSLFSIGNVSYDT